jgi:hypothetical protein
MGVTEALEEDQNLYLFRGVTEALEGDKNSYLFRGCDGSPGGG